MQNEITILEYQPEFAQAFEQINKAWISTMFVLEDIDCRVLEDPQTYIIEPGGKIWFASHPQLGIIGTCALLKQAEGIYELTKMGVLERARGMKAGELLLQYVIEYSQKNNLDCLFLLTNSKCQAAIHLYLKHGFVHDADIMERFGKSYQRCDVAMRYQPPGEKVSPV